jgi:hypothetical protein
MSMVYFMYGIEQEILEEKKKREAVNKAMTALIEQVTRSTAPQVLPAIRCLHLAKRPGISPEGCDKSPKPRCHSTCDRQDRFLNFYGSLKPPPGLSQAVPQKACSPTAAS